MAEDVRRIPAPAKADGSANGRPDSNNGNGWRDAQSLPRTSISPINADRPVFTLSVAADLLGMHPRTLRIYEEENLVIPARTPTGRRRYSQNDIKRFQFIQNLTQGHKVNLPGVRIILDMIDQLDRCGVDYRPQLLARLENEQPARSVDDLDDEE